MPRRRDSSIEQVLKDLLDLLAFFLAANLAFDLRYYIDWPSILGEVVKKGPAPWAALYQAMPYMLLGWALIFAVFGLYRSNLRQREEIALLIKAQAVAGVELRWKSPRWKTRATNGSRRRMRPALAGTVK